MAMTQKLPGNDSEIATIGHLFESENNRVFSESILEKRTLDVHVCVCRKVEYKILTSTCTFMNCSKFHVPLRFSMYVHK